MAVCAAQGVSWRLSGSPHGRFSSPLCKRNTQNNSHQGPALVAPGVATVKVAQGTAGGGITSALVIPTGFGTIPWYRLGPWGLCVLPQSRQGLGGSQVNSLVSRPGVGWGGAAPFSLGLTHSLSADTHVSVTLGKVFGAVEDRNFFVSSLFKVTCKGNTLAVGLAWLRFWIEEGNYVFGVVLFL